MEDTQRQADLIELENLNSESVNNDIVHKKKIDVSRKSSVPRLVKLSRKENSFGLRVRGQSIEGGPRWLIDGREFQNLQTVSAVLPESAAEESGILVGDKILEINGTNVEGAQHDKIQELMTKCEDSVDILLITPGDIKMLDIPASLLIHRSDGSTTSINDPSLLMKESIDSLLSKEHEISQQMQNENEVKVQMNTWVSDKEQDSKESTVNSEEENHVKEDGEKTSQRDDVTGDCDVTENDLVNDSSETIESDVEQREHKDDQKTSPEFSEDTISNLDAADANYINNEKMSTDVDNATIESGQNSSVLSNEQCCSRAGKCSCPDDLERTCLCDDEPQTFSKRFLTKRETEIRKLREQMKTTSSSMRKLKLSPFSPSVFNGLSPYFQIDVMDSDKVHIEQIPTYTWKHANQRPTALSVLDPKDEYRLENSEIERNISVWSSNLSKKSDRTRTDNTDQIHDFEMQLKVLYKNLMKNRSRRSRQRLDRYLESNKFRAVSKNFIKANAKDTVIAYLNYGYVH